MMMDAPSTTICCFATVVQRSTSYTADQARGGQDALPKSIQHSEACYCTGYVFKKPL